ncbi:MAG: hypothetical protein ACE5OR_11325 [bacterium]
MAKKGRNPVPENETPRRRFVRLAESRTNAALDKIRLLGNLAAGQYEYTAEDIERIFGALEEAIKVTRSKFERSKEDRKRFTLQ